MAVPYLQWIADLTDRAFRSGGVATEKLPVIELRSEIAPSDLSMVFGDDPDPSMSMDDRMDDEGTLEIVCGLSIGDIVLTCLEDGLHRVAYQTPCRRKSKSRRRNEFLFEAYSSGKEWIDGFDNGFGKFYRTVDRDRYAIWSYNFDFISFFTAEWQQRENGKCW